MTRVIPTVCRPKVTAAAQGSGHWLVLLALVIADLALTKHFNLNTIINAVATFAFFMLTIPSLTLDESGSSGYSLWWVLIYYAFMALSDQQVYLFPIVAVAQVAVALVLIVASHYLER